MNAKNKANVAMIKFISATIETESGAHQKISVLAIPENSEHIGLDLTKKGAMSFSKALSALHQFAALHGLVLVETTKTGQQGKSERVVAQVAPPYEKFAFNSDFFDDIVVDPNELTKKPKPESANTDYPTDPKVIALLDAIIENEKIFGPGQVRDYMAKHGQTWTAGFWSYVRDTRREQGINVKSIQKPVVRNR